MRQTSPASPLFLTARSALAALLSIVLLAGCGGDANSNDGSAPEDPAVCATDDPVADKELERLPEGLPLDEWGTVVQVADRRGYIGAESISDRTIVELYPEIARAVRSGGYAMISGENEGFEAELFFQKGDDFGTFLLRKGPCEGQVRIKLIYGAPPGGDKGQ